MSVCFEGRVLSGRGLCDELITRPEESYRLWCVVMCDLETSRMRRPWPALGRGATGKEKKKKTSKKFNLVRCNFEHETDWRVAMLTQLPYHTFILCRSVKYYTQISYDWSQLVCETGAKRSVIMCLFCGLWNICTSLSYFFIILGLICKTVAHAPVKRITQWRGVLPCLRLNVLPESYLKIQLTHCINHSQKIHWPKQVLMVPFELGSKRRFITHVVCSLTWKHRMNNGADSRAKLV